MRLELGVHGPAGHDALSSAAVRGWIRSANQTLYRDSMRVERKRRQKGQKTGVLVGRITVPKLFRFVGRYWYLYVVMVCACFGASIAYLHNARYVYTVTMLIAPVQESAQRLPGGLQSLASIAGINLPSGDSANFQVYLDALQSRATADAVAKKQELMRQLYPRDWSEADQMWREPDDPMARLYNQIRAFLGVPLAVWAPPSGERLQLYLSRVLQIQKTRTSPVVTAALLTDKPQLGQELLLALHESVDTILRERTLQRTNSYIQYLTTALRNTTIADYRETLIAALSEQEKTRMMASSGVAFVAEPFGQPVVSSRPTSPKIVGVMIPAFVFGLVLATLLASIFDGYFRRLWARSEEDSATGEYLERLRPVQAAE
jgi:hypothetical protein